MLGARTGRRMLVLALALATPSFAAFQEPEAAPAAPAPAAPLPSDPAAVELIRAVAAAQHPQHAERAVDGFAVELQLREYGETPHDYGFGLSYSAHGAETLVLRIDDPERGGTVRKGWDGKRHWLQEGDGPIQDLGGHEYEQDREAIEDALDLSHDLLLALDFGALAREAEGWTLAEGPEKERLLGGRVRRRGHLWDFTLVLPAADGKLGPLPSDLFLRRLNEDPETRAEQPVLLERHVAFTHYKRFAGRATPQNLHEFLPGETEPARTLEVRDLRWTDSPVHAGKD